MGATRLFKSQAESTSGRTRTDAHAYKRRYDSPVEIDPTAVGKMESLISFAQKQYLQRGLGVGGR